jgi:hypothetical protein
VSTLFDDAALAGASPSDLLARARELIERPDSELVGLWPRAGALLARRALEETLDVLWAKKAPGLAGASARAQLMCLPSYLGKDADLAADVVYTWNALSEACHHHPYEVGPTAAELHTHLDTVHRFIERAT